MKTTRCLFAVFIILLSATALFAADADKKSEAAKSEEPKVVKDAKVSITAKDSKTSDVFASLEKQSGDKILVESSVKSAVTVSFKDVSLESAIESICKAGKFEWRKIYISPDSNLLDQPDKFAATVRLMSGLSFPDLVLAGSSTNKVNVYCSNSKAVKASEDKMVKDLGMSKVYLITNDAAVAAKALDKEKDKTEDSAAVNQYVDMAKQQMDMFIKMSPEDRERVLMDSISMYEQADPRYMSTMMQTLMRSNPDLLRRMASKQTEMLFNMSPEDRRAMLKLNMQVSQMLTPEQIQILTDDQKAIMQDMGSMTPGN